MDSILKVSCNDEKGLILRISEVVFKNGLNYENTSEFVDHENNRFYMRAELNGKVDTKELTNTLGFTTRCADLLHACAQKRYCNNGYKRKPLPWGFTFAL